MTALVLWIETGIFMVDEDILGTSGKTLTFHLLENSGQICLGVVGTSDCTLLCQIIYLNRSFVTDKCSK